MAYVRLLFNLNNISSSYILGLLSDLLLNDLKCRLVIFVVLSMMYLFIESKS